MGEQQQESRINKYDKRRKLTRSITIFIILGIALAIVLFFMWIFGGNSDNTKKSEPASSEIQREDDDQIDYTQGAEDENVKEHAEKDKAEDEKESEDEEDEDAVKTEEVESSDANVSKAYKGDWKAVETEQSGPHTTDFSNGSQDRIEIREAMQSVTGLDDMIEFWVGNGGNGGQKVVATISSADKSEAYRIYLSWIDEEGWKPTKVEELKEIEY